MQSPLSIRYPDFSFALKLAQHQICDFLASLVASILSDELFVVAIFSTWHRLRIGQAFLLFMDFSQVIS